MAYSTTRNSKAVCLRSLNLGQHNAQQYILNVSSKVRLQYFFRLEEIKKQNTFPCKFHNLGKP